MTNPSEFQAVVKQLRDSTGDPNAWMSGLSQADIGTALLYGLGGDHHALAPIVAKIRANHPAVFGPATAPPAPLDPSGDPPQTGAAATAIKKAESDLAQQNSSTATLDLMVISAILNAHATSSAGAETLRALQHEIDDAVRTRTDLDTPAGARDFQRFLIGKLRHIARVIEEASLDDRSKAALATAWTALYESTKRVEGAAGDANPENAAGAAAPKKPALAPTTTPTPAAAAPSDLLPYGADLPLDLGPDPLAGLLPPPAPAAPPAAAPAPAPELPLPVPPLPAAPTLPAAGSLGGAPSGLPLPRPGDLGGPAGEGLTLADLLAAEDAALAEPALKPEAEDDVVEGKPGADGKDPGAPTEEEAAPDAPAAEPESSVVKLPGGEQIHAPSPALARVLGAALAGTPIGEAFQREDLPIPAPGTPVPHPVDPARVGTGDVAMFTDRHALAIDAARALIDGQIRPVSAISGPSFLGWLHPPAVGAETAPSATTPNGSNTPAPTRPAAAAGPAR